MFRGTRNTLHQIGIRHRTDKVDANHTLFGVSYMERYAPYFDPIRDQPIRFLEIGVLNGASLRAWREFFPNAEIHGIDVRPECKVHENLSAGIHVHIVDCSSEKALSAFTEKYRGYFDVILDDGSHINDITLKTFRHLYFAVKPVGFYIVEDLACAYVGDDLPKYTPSWPGISVTQEVPKNNDPMTMLNLYRDLHAMIDIPSDKHLYQIEYLHHYPYIVVIRKNEMYRTGGPATAGLFQQYIISPTVAARDTADVSKTDDSSTVE